MLTQSRGFALVLRMIVVVVSIGLGRAGLGQATGSLQSPQEVLAKDLTPFLHCLSGTRPSFVWQLEVKGPIDNQPQAIAVQLERIDGESFSFVVKHEKAHVALYRTATQTTLVLPDHKVAFTGSGAAPGPDSLAPAQSLSSLVSPGSWVAFGSTLLGAGPQFVASSLASYAKLEYQPQQSQWVTKGGRLHVKSHDDGTADLSLHYEDWSAKLKLLNGPAPVDHDNATRGMQVVTLDRVELERHLARGVRRALEIVAPSPLLTTPDTSPRKVAHGELKWVDGHRVAMLHGSPEEMGQAHGELLKEEVHRCIDSVLYTFGMVQTITTGKWFPHELQKAYDRLAPHIPESHKRETIALAQACGLDPHVAQTLNVFPEMFHCSGFAVFGSATADGKLYHGRVLDYMTTIGLQHAAVTFVMAGKGQIPFVNIGYAGFIGSVSGMNAEQISLGEMGGRGEGHWDGVPMATLMRRALEECHTLSEVKHLWQTSPRTCEYYYVFADGKDNSACGVAATPESVLFIAPGEAHPLLGEGIRDAVVLSAGDRLKTLRERVTEFHGKIDTERAQWLMSRPVAMKSNLHNVLFVPADGVCYVAHADHKHPAAERPYVRLDLRELLRGMSEPLAQVER